MTIEVLVELKLKKIDKTFTYSVPQNLEEQIKVGIRVLVPFGKQKLEGFVLKINNAWINRLYYNLCIFHKIILLIKILRYNFRDKNIKAHYRKCK